MHLEQESCGDGPDALLEWGMFLRSLASLLLAFGMPLPAHSHREVSGKAPKLSPAAQQLLTKAFEGLPEATLVDVHAHLLGLGEGGTGAWVNPEKLSLLHPFKRIQTGLYMRASGAEGGKPFDRAYEDSLVARARAFPHPYRMHLLAFDHRYGRDGKVDLKHSEFHVPNAYMVEVARRHPDLFVPVISVHPNRTDACEELKRWAGQGVRYVKWLPNAQGIDPADPRHDAFYKTLRDLGMVLLTHVGEEKAVQADEDQKFGNPLRFRRALDLGVMVIMAHCASLGRNEDLDHPGRTASNFDLFLRLMDEPRYEGRLYGDISAITQFNRLPAPLLEILARPRLQARMLNGSDYPLPAVNLVIWIRKLVALKLITPSEHRALKEIFRANPLVFDFVLKRSLRGKKGERLDPSIFAARPELPDGRLRP